MVKWGEVLEEVFDGEGEEKRGEMRMGNGEGKGGGEDLKNLYVGGTKLKREGGVWV